MIMKGAWDELKEGGIGGGLHERAGQTVPSVVKSPQRLGLRKDTGYLSIHTSTYCFAKYHF